MEYYIMKLYQEEKKKDGRVESGFNRFSKVEKIWVTGCIIVMFLAMIAAFVIALMLPQGGLWLLAMAVLCMVSVVVLFYIERKNEKKHLKMYADSQETKLEILHKLLLNRYGVVTLEKLEYLIELYRKYVESRRLQKEKRAKFVAVLVSTVGGILSVSISNLEIIGLSFSWWAYFAILLLVCLACVALYNYFVSNLDSLSREYEAMIKDLEDLKFWKYI